MFQGLNKRPPGTELPAPVLAGSWGKTIHACIPQSRLGRKDEGWRRNQVTGRVRGSPGPDLLSGLGHVVTERVRGAGPPALHVHPPACSCVIPMTPLLLRDSTWLPGFSWALGVGHRAVSKTKSFPHAAFMPVGEGDSL